MHKFLVALLALAALELINCAAVSDTDTKQTYYIANPRAIDYKFVGKKDEHRFGVELKENKQFHHTRTAEDGVRLGCYGYELEGKKYSTHYVADAKGYRLVPDQGLITVYPKDGGEARKASFVQSFNEDEIKSANIRYFFPDGCQSPKLENGPPESGPVFSDRISPVVDRVAVIPPIQKKSNKPIEIPVNVEVMKPELFTPKARTETSPAPATPDAPIQPKAPLNTAPVEQPVELNQIVQHDKPYAERREIVEPEGVFTPPPATPSATIEARIETTAKPVADRRIVDPKPLFRPRIATATTNPIELPLIDPEAPLTPSITPYKLAESKCSDTCCDDNRPSILMSRAAPGSCCKGVSKIVIPIDTEVLERISLPELTEVTTETKNVVMLKKLLKLVEKYNL